MEISQLKVFVTVLQTGSFTKAAELLNTQKSYVSRVISQLEKSQGVRLLERNTRSISPTEIGRDFFLRANSILDSIEETTSFLQQKNLTPQGTLKITCGVDFGNLIVHKWIGEYLTAFPNVAVEADFTNRIVDIIYEGCDIAIRVGELKDSTLIAKKIGSLSYKIYAHREMRKHSKISQPKDLLNLPIFWFSSGSHKPIWRLQHKKTMKIEDVEIQHPRAKINNYFAIKELLMKGLGISMLPTIFINSPSIDDALITLLDDWTLPEIPVYAVFPSNRYLSPKVQAFIDIAIKFFNHEAL